MNTKNSCEYNLGASVYDLLTSGIKPANLIGEKFMCTLDWFNGSWKVLTAEEVNGDTLICHYPNGAKYFVDLHEFIDWARDTYIIVEEDYEYEELA